MTSLLVSSRGFLPLPDPLLDLASGEGVPAQVGAALDGVAAQMPTALMTTPDRFQAQLAQLPIADFAGITHLPTLERLFMLYAYFANACIYGVPEQPQEVIPASVAIPFCQVAHLLDRPPVLSYATLVLHNWVRLDPQGPIALGNLAPLVSFQNLPDEHWFGLVHVNVEANAASAMQSLVLAVQAARQHDSAEVITHLEAISNGIKAMLSAFHQMTDGCDPDVYHQQVRPYIFGLTGVIYEGVAAYEGKPQTFSGGSGAQSSTIPALVAALGVQHEQTGLMQHLAGMQAYMPRQHRHFIESLTTTDLRDYVLANAQDDALKGAYNYCIQQLLVFRKAHLHYARVYIFDKVTNPVGTGGTPFMDWLTQLLKETEAHLIS